MTKELPAYAKRIAAARENSSWTQAEVAQRSGFSRAYVGHLECGRRRLNTNAIIALNRVLGIPREVLIADMLAALDSE